MLFSYISFPEIQSFEAEFVYNKADSDWISIYLSSPMVAHMRIVEDTEQKAS